MQCTLFCILQGVSSPHLMCCLPSPVPIDETERLLALQVKLAVGGWQFSVVVSILGLAVDSCGLELAAGVGS